MDAKAAPQGVVIASDFAYSSKATYLVALLGDAVTALRAAEKLDYIHRNRTAENRAAMPTAWAHARLGDRKTGISELGRAIAASIEAKANDQVPL